MAAQKRTQNCRKKCLHTYEPKTELMKVLNSLDSSRSYERLLENPKTRASTELFLPCNDFKTSSTVNF